MSSTWLDHHVWLDGDALKFDAEVKVRETKTRRRGELAPFALEPRACVPRDEIQYWMYNDIAPRAHGNASRTQFELTLLLPRPLGVEGSKTLGHIHNAPEIGAPTFAELFEVLHGAARLMFYALDAATRRTTFCGWLEAHAGEQIVMPPNLYHLTLNAGKAPLVFADVISKRARGLYDDVRATRGAPYYARSDGEWRANPAFVSSPPLVESTELLVASTRSLFTQFLENSAVFDWLDEPSQFAVNFPRLEQPWIALASAT